MIKNQRLTISIEIIHNNLPYTFIFPHGCATNDLVESFNGIATELNSMIELASKAAKENAEKSIPIPQEITPELVS
jgi:hypothetical protein